MSLNASTSVPRARVPLALLAVTALIVAGASIAATSAYFELVAKSPSSAGSAATSVVDDAGRTVRVPTNPTHVVVLGPNIMDSVVRLGLRSNVVGVDCSSSAFGGLLGDYTPNQTAEWNLSSSLCVQALPSIDTEELLNKSPDLILASSIISEGTLDEFSVTYGVPVVWLMPSTLTGIVVDVSVLSQIYPGNAAVAPLEAELQSTLASAAAFDQNLSFQPNASLPTVLLTYYVDPNAGYYSYGPGTFGDALITLAGGASISRTASVPFPVVSGSEALSANPSFVVYGTGSLGEPLSSYSQGPSWTQLTGTKLPMDVVLFTEADPTMVLVGVGELTDALHPVT